MEYRRAFIAINLPEKVKKSIVESSAQWRNLPVNWTYEQNLHMTLLFLGDITDDEVKEIGEKISEVARRTEPFTIKFTEFVYGPKDFTLTERPRMIWLEGEENENLAVLCDELGNALQMGERRKKFRPHITVGRIHAGRGIGDFPKTLNKELDASVQVASIELMESELRSGKRHYGILLSAKFGV